MYDRMSHLLRSLTLAACAAVALTAVTGPASAQFAHFFKDAALTPEDIDILSDAAQELYTKSGVSAGEKREWQNDKTGAKGVVDVLEVENAGQCVVLRHIAETKKKPHITYYVRRCLDDAGKWVLSAN